MKGFFFQLLLPNNQSQKTTAEQCNLNAGQGRIVLFLDLKNACMAKLYTPGEIKSAEAKGGQPECLTLGTLCKIMVKDIAITMPQVVNISSMIVIKGILQ